MIERTILSNLIYSEEYCRKVMPHLREDYFTDPKYKGLFHLVEKHVAKYNVPPTVDTIRLDLESIKEIPEKIYHEMTEELSFWKFDEDVQYTWLIDKTEQFCQDKALYNALMDAVSIVDDEKSSISRGSIPKLLSDAISVSFDDSIGHDYLDDFESRFDYYHLKETKIPFDLHYFNEITNGGVSRKTLNIILAGTGTGKSLFMCHAAASNLVKGYNVLYITLEMAEEKIAERIDANLLDTQVDELEHMDRNTYTRKIEKLRSNTVGKLIIKEYPTASASAANFRALINELKQKKNFKPDIIYIDYLNICASARIKSGSNVGSYAYNKAIAEELRGLSIEFNVPLWTATQTNRSGYNASDVELTETSDSFGIPMSADLFFALISTDELQDAGQIMVKQLKNRYADLTRLKRFIIGVDRPKMRLFDAEESAQRDIMDGPVFDQTDVGKKYQVDKDKFKDLLFE